MREEATRLTASFIISSFGVEQPATTERSTMQYQTSQRLTLLSKETLLRTKKFNMRRQEEGEPVHSFVTSPALLASRTLQLSHTMK